jgi:tRNA nucleotidyltransferase (CCA-adding enzyme)
VVNTPALNNKKYSVISQAQELNVDSYVIGGFVRDLILNRDFKRYRHCCRWQRIKLALKVSHSKKTTKYKFQDVWYAMLRFEDTDIEFVGARKESYHFDSRNPVVDGTLEDDQNRRDFTALALSLNATNFGGLSDPLED